MKNYFIILGLLFTLNLKAQGFENIYLQKDGYNRHIPHSFYNCPSCRCYQSPYSYKKINSNNRDRLRRLHYLKELEKFNRNYYNNHLSLKRNNGVLTGFSPSITNDDIKDINTYPNESYDTNIRPRNYSMELFRAPKTNDSYYRRNGKNDIGDRGVVGKMGVTIIYD